MFNDIPCQFKVDVIHIIDSLRAMPTLSIPTSLPPGALYLTYKSCSTWPLPSHTGTSSDSPVHISILDSSFNPPTLAHLAIASSDPPPSSPSSSSSSSSSLPYTARLLLFSIRNVDKKPQPSDPSLEQRLSMVHLLAQRIPDLPIAVGILDEPTFAGKSHVVHNFLKTISTSTSSTSTETTTTTTTIGDRNILHFR
ncbi:hypothetical protein BCR39DRAFT_137700 [Naematelia encephala]|uniref:Cytidyltransferase-like domain-containing protein n=1 Tax=Naematelia encephala TaxID=71784 RepID=A0A1Y2BLD5_9TREE|nr:hypothetical protein BCR39DRAFT_137700 [Naematelia encephala]